MLRGFVIAFAFFLSCAAFAQEEDWQPIGTESFEAIAGAEDGGLLVIRYPGDILRSSDTGGTWSVVYRGHARLVGFGRAQHVPTDDMMVYGDSGVALVSSDSGRTWEPSAQEASSAMRGAPNRYTSPPSFIHLKEEGTINSYSPADSAWFAVGEPGLMYRWNSSSTQWNELHRAPYIERPFENDSTACVGAKIDFSTPAYGAIALKNKFFCTRDSGVTWSESIVPDTNSISSFFLISDTATLAATEDGKLFYCSGSQSWVSCDSILYPAVLQGETQGRSHKPILQIGWQDAYDGQLFLLTDSELFTASSDLHIVTSAPFPFRVGERARAASFPNQYIGFLMTDSATRVDTLTADGRDTLIVRDTGYIYRSLDGGTMWSLALKNIPGLQAMCFPSVRRGFACGVNGTIMVTNDSGSTWSQSNARTSQTLRSISFANDTVGFAVGDSGTVLFTYNAGRFWRGLPTEPLFMHPTASYTGIAFPTSQRVCIVTMDRGYASPIKVPTFWQRNRRMQTRISLTVSVRPNPATGPITFDIGFSGAAPEYGEVPELKICDLSGKVFAEPSSISFVTTSEWSAEADLSFLQPGVYSAVVSYAGAIAITKFVKQ